MNRREPENATGADAFARLATELHGAAGVDETMDAVVEFALRADNCTYAGVMLAVRGGRAEIGAVTDPIVTKLYQLQLDTDEGPTLAALAERTAVYISDVRVEPRWPVWRDAAEAAGIGSVLQVPMCAAGAPVGVLSLYQTIPHGFTADDEAIAQILARHACVAVATARSERSLAQAVDARKLVGQAMGILMERFDLDSDQAFAILRRYSQDTNTKLRDVAQHLVDTRSLPPT